ncbi:uncharacterized protein AC631_05369 [Debaryomyces fabryi]|uniref:beta-glucosidase n=1 Tax=Debaryomyces fabryi TaxID=58627 RepID=A0A0V1PRK4_9ASCO|nr:uncharacterized protein AC631_05369 [Debaryomyces fabryi]KRZ98870.1 hypothetical protein AC631_05369 [Debaryomyces fabryi]CUM55871.1 unnamed protein product [Debaryomyces fabryi]
MKYIDTTLLVAFLALSNAAPSKKRNETINSNESFLIFGTSNQYSTSPPFYPSPLGGRIENVWLDAYSQAREIVETLNIAEKVNITTGIGMAWSPCGGSTGSLNGKGLESNIGFCGNDGPLGLRGADFDSAYPAALTVASSFNRQLIYDRADAIGYEFKSKGVDFFLGPVSGPIGYKALAGRGWEGFGADPYLQGEAMKYTVEGIQKNKVVAVSKHFIGNEQDTYRFELEVKEDGSNTTAAISSNIDDRSMHEIYLWPFAEAVKAGTGSIMCSYNRINGSAGCANSYTLNNLLKTELGFQGFVMSDWYATKSGVSSALSGLDMNMPGDNMISEGSYFGGNLTQAVLNGTIPEDKLNDMATRILASYFVVDGNHTGPNFQINSKKTYDHEYINSKTGKGFGEIVMVNEHVDPRNDFTDKIAYQSAVEGIVLLKNEHNILPLKNYTKIAILGEAAGISPDGFNCKFGSCIGGAPPSGYGSGAGSPSKFISPVDALGERCRNENIQYDFVSSSWDLSNSMDRSELAQAVIVFAASIAGEAVAIVDGNNGDRNNASLWYNADELIKNTTAYNNNTIVVVTTPGSVNIESFVENENVTAILMSSYLGQEAGSAITNVLFGDYNPSGRIPFTIAKDDLEYVPVIYNTTLDEPQDEFTRSIFLDYRYYDYYNITPRYEFGYGLSYSNFTFGNLTISEVNVPSKDLLSESPYLPAYNFSSDNLDPNEYTFPEGFNKLEGYIYPYIDSIEVNTTKEFSYPEGYSTDQLASPPIAGGSLGGNKQLWDVAYHVEAELTNNGPYDGSYVAQLYVGIPSTDKFPNAPVQLRGFDKLSLNAKESGTVEFDITRKDLSVWDVMTQSWIVQHGSYNLYVGSSSRNLELVDTINIS